MVGVEPEGCPTWHAAAAAGGPVDVEVGGLAADALGASRLGEHGWAALSGAGAGSVLVPAEAIAAAAAGVANPAGRGRAGGATALAALTSGAYRPGPGERVAVVVCGGNADPSDLASAGPVGGWTWVSRIVMVRARATRVATSTMALQHEVGAEDQRPG